MKIPPECEYTRVPFVLHPVASIEIDDGLGNTSTTSFTYKSGKFYHQDFAFHGFGVVTKTRPDNSTETAWYHVEEPYWKGRPSTFILADPDGRILTEKLCWWTKYLLSEDDNGPAFVNLYQDKNRFENNDEIYTQQNYDYDLSNGNLINVTQSGSVGDPVKTETAYHNHFPASGLRSYAEVCAQ